MSILINKDSKILVQGITGKSGLFHTQQCRAYGSQIVAGVTPGKGGVHIEGIPVFNTVAEAVHYTGATVSMIFVPPPGAADAILESCEAGLELAAVEIEREGALAKGDGNERALGCLEPGFASVIAHGEAALGQDQAFDGAQKAKEFVAVGDFALRAKLAGQGGGGGGDLLPAAPDDAAGFGYGRGHGG